MIIKDICVNSVKDIRIFDFISVKHVSFIESIQIYLIQKLNKNYKKENSMLKIPFIYFKFPVFIIS